MSSSSSIFHGVFLLYSFHCDDGDIICDHCTFLQC